MNLKLERPKAPTRDEYLRARVTSEEYRQVQELADLHCKGVMSDWIRLASVSYRPRISKGKASLMKTAKIWSPMFLMLFLLTACGGQDGPAPTPVQKAAAPLAHQYEVHFASASGFKRFHYEFTAPGGIFDDAIGAIDLVCVAGDPNPPCATEYVYSFTSDQMDFGRVTLIDNAGVPLDITLYKDGVPVEASTLTNPNDVHTFTAGI